MKTKDLTGEALARMVALACGYQARLLPITNVLSWFDDRGRFVSTVAEWEPHENPRQGQPIIERERIATWGGSDGLWWATNTKTSPSGYNGASYYIDTNEDDSYSGSAQLAAGMRAFVANVYGEEVPE